MVEPGRELIGGLLQADARMASQGSWGPFGEPSRVKLLVASVEETGAALVGRLDPGEIVLAPRFSHSFGGMGGQAERQGKYPNKISPRFHTNRIGK